MNEEKKIVIKRLKAARDLGKFMADYYYELDEASNTGKQKIAWCTSVGPAEILRGLGFLIYFPETHSAMLGTTRMATDLIPVANALGYSPEICSYLTADIGAFVEGVTPLSRAFKGITSVPKPDVLVFNTNQCRDVQDWFAWYGEKFNVPVVGIHTYRGVKDVTDSHITSISKQLEDIIEPLEKVAGRKFDMDEFKNAVALSRECSDLWDKCLGAAAATPSPLTFFDGTTLMGPAVVGRGTQQALDAYNLLLEELDERVQNGDGALEDEQFRIYWDGMPVWGRLSMHSKLFAGLNANVIASTYCSSWIFSALDPKEPFESMARAYTELFIVRSDEYKEKYIKEKLDFYKIDGVVYHDARTCPNNTNCQYGMPERLAKETGIPSLTIDGDLNDLRCLSDEQTKTNVEAFIEQLEERK
ncbi:MAG: 2-hydroxyacyl-CoA dehydratase family protein [Deltaproteobacteria bacterium]|nr:2-hydroxyacyl-CoA dehydratase family protein [Deltaproteobacteria bacterium]NNL43594.1 2-hydroxyacyl-CoA dehydratase [Desulfobacterales bacterium]NNL77760.1 2-hydroxyacyl-CoA dehydratase [Desulfobacterales bacterium]